MVSTRWEKQEAERKKKKKNLRLREWRAENPERVMTHGERQKRREAADCLKRRLEGHHKLRSSLLPKALPKKTILSHIHFIKRQFDSFKGLMVLPIKPMTSRVRLSLVTPQAA